MSLCDRPSSGTKRTPLPARASVWPILKGTTSSRVPWRMTTGQVNVAIGVDGLNPIVDYRGSQDMFGNELSVTQIAIADELASAAELVMRKSDRIPVAIIRGVEYVKEAGSIKSLIRSREEDLFR